METTAKKQRMPLSGSFFNYLMGNNMTAPVVGKGATILHYTDRTVAEVLEVSQDGKTVVLEHLDAKCDKRFPGGMGHQNWIFEPTGRKFTIVWRQNAWRTVTNTVAFTKEFIAKYGEAVSLARVLTEEEKSAVYGGHVFPKNVVAGITRPKIEYHKINILFGEKNYYYDWEF